MFMDRKTMRLKYACYTTGLTMSIVTNLPPLLFLTFRSLYGISFTQLGLLVLINYVTQLGIDLIFSFFSHRLSIQKSVKATPFIAVAGLLFYAASPFLFPNATYMGLLIGTIVFSAAGGFAEVLISPVIAAIPAPNPDREMSKLHSVYAWGVVVVVIVSTLFLLAFDKTNWPLLTIIMALIPLCSAILFIGTTLPPMETPERASGAFKLLQNKGIWFCFIAIFLGGAAECTMSQWASGYLEQALQIPKVWGDIFGVALFAITLGIGRTLYGKYGHNLGKVLFLGAIAASACYLIAAVTQAAVVGLLACAFTGFCTAMFWPGNLVVASERFPSGGIFIYALMAAGGDLGASIGPQIIGVVTDSVIRNPDAVVIAQNIGLTSEQFGMKIGMLIGMLFPFAAIFFYYSIMKSQRKS